MLLQGIDHVATITHDGDRLKQFYVDVFDATIERDGPEFPGGPRMIIINLAAGTENGRGGVDILAYLRPFEVCLEGLSNFLAVIDEIQNERVFLQRMDAVETR